MYAGSSQKKTRNLDCEKHMNAETECQASTQHEWQSRVEIEIFSFR